MKKTILKCDVMNCNNEVTKEDVDLQVIFITDQTEGRSAAPYLDKVKVDLCKEHFDNIVINGNYLIASGAQGHNQYWFLTRGHK